MIKKNFFNIRTTFLSDDFQAIKLHLDFGKVEIFFMDAWIIFEILYMKMLLKRDYLTFCFDQLNIITDVKWDIRVKTSHQTKGMGKNIEEN